MAAKYVMIDGIMPIVFSECHKHSDFKAVGEITSAGFFYLDNKGNPVVYGESMSLNLGSDPNDAKWLRKLFKEDWEE